MSTIMKGARGGVAVFVALFCGGCSHAIDPGVTFNHSPRFDFRRPPCEPALPTEGHIREPRIRYLGAGGFLIHWQEHVLLTGPFFSNPSLFRVGFRHIEPDREAILQGLGEVENVGAIVVGHAHYDHLGDLPLIARELARDATLLVSRSAARALAPWPNLQTRVLLLESTLKAPVPLQDAGGRPLPFRIRGFPSDHAPHYRGITVMDGDIEASQRPWEKRSYWSLKTGQTYAAVIELTDGSASNAEVRYRILYQDAASPFPAASFPPASEQAYDLVIVVMPSSHMVPPYPRNILLHTRPSHAILSHYENFFTDWGYRKSFVLGLSRDRANQLLETVDQALRDGGQELRPPTNDVCGPSADGWTMPLVGEWIEFGGGR